MKRPALLISVAAVGLALGVGLGAANAKSVEVRYNTWAKPGEAQYTAAVKFGEVLEKLSNGKFKTIVFPGDQLGTPKEVMEQLAMNTTQIEASGDPGMPEIENLALPYLMKDMANYIAVLQSDVGQVWNKQLIDQAQLRLLGILPRSPREISTNKVVNKMADLKGMKIRVPERDYYVKSFEAFGAKPTPMSFNEVYTSLQTGVVDGQENPIETIWAMKFYEVQKCIVMVDYINKPAWVQISEKFWQKLSDQERGWFEQAQRASEKVVTDVLGQQQKELLDKMKAAGLIITYPDKKEWRDATQWVRDELGKKTWGEALYKKISAIGKKDIK